jgi:N-acetylneuraminate synthase
MPVRFIAEVSSNHSRDIDRCLTFIDVAADIGCDGVKFQLFRIDKMFAPEILERSETHRKRRDWELPLGFLTRIAERCKQRGIQFGCTPFYLEAVEELRPYVDFYKVASYELLWDDLLRAVAKTGKPVVLSTGMADDFEIEDADLLLMPDGDATYLHCVSGYPVPVEDCNLSAIDTIRELTRNPVGWSDHSVNPGVIYSAVFRYNASMIEFHLDLDGEGAEYKTGHCWLPEQIAPVIQAVRDGERADGDGVKRPMPSEMADREWRRDPIDGLRPMKVIRDTFGL